ncbi:unnamed protein product [Phyllotreta striolata]|uniref:Luciferin 4-monooxygenase n=1 Tax=Phyllotreta striolata TaxID=444603 RepID=A0A9N9TL59_PHYSR|nr:unnamed protein product [Phyllotreta striolata]
MQDKNITDKNENYIFDVPLDFQPNENGLGRLFFRNMRRYEHSIAQYIVETGEEETYGTVLKRSIRTASHIQSRNLAKGDIIVICSYNQKYAVVPFIASIFLAIPVASLDPALSLLDISHLMKEVRPKMLFIVPEVVELIEDSLQEAGVEAEIVIFGKTEKHTEFSTFLEPLEDEEDFTPRPIDTLSDTAVILFSSGTTGLPKGIMISHRSLLIQSHILLKSNNLGAVTLSYATLYWISSIVFLVGILQSGGAKVIHAKFDPIKIWHLIEQYRVSTLFLAPSMAISMIKAGRPDNINTTSLWCFLIGGASIQQKYLLDLRENLPGTFVFQGYGQTEVAGILSFFNTSKVKETLFLHYKPKSVGLIVPGTKYRVVELETGRNCGPNQQGELRVKSNSLMNGYYNKDSSETYDEDGWLRTGDIVYYDEDMCFYIVDRIKELLKFRSFHVPPAMLEQIISAHPAVAQVVVIGVPDEEDGDHPMALIILNEQSNGNVGENEIRDYVEERVPDRLRLRGGVKFLNSFPLTPSGKISRKDLRNLVMKGEI